MQLIIQTQSNSPVQTAETTIQDQLAFQAGHEPTLITATTPPFASFSEEIDLLDDALLRNEGYCFPLNQMVTTPSGLLYVQEVFEHVKLAPNSANGDFAVQHPFFNRYGEVELSRSFSRNGKRPTFRLTTGTGGTITTTARHPHHVMNPLGFEVKKMAGEIVPGDHLIVPRHYVDAVDIGEPGIYPLNALYLFGVLYADANFGEASIRVSNDDPDVKHAIVEHGGNFFGFQPKSYGPRGATGSMDYHFNGKKKITEIYAHFGLEPCLAAGKHFGFYVRSLNKEGVAAVLQGYFDCECTLTDDGSINTISASWKLLSEAKALLLAHFGIIAILKPRFVAAYPDNEYWELCLNGAEAESYVRQIGFRSRIRQARASVCLGKTRNPNIDVIPNLGPLLSTIHEASDTTRDHVHLVRDYKGDAPRAEVTYQRLRRILDAEWEQGPALDRLSHIYAEKHFYDVVTKVEQLPPEPTFDFAMPGTHSLLLNGFISRNSDDRVASMRKSAA